MITNEKTLNKLHADTETILFRLEDKPEAIHKMMEIIRDTPEYLQLMNMLPCHAEEDLTAEWWKSKECSHLLAELMQVLNAYTPQGFRFGPCTATSNDFGYWKDNIADSLLFRIHFSINAGYRINDPRGREIIDNFYHEITSLFAAQGYESWENDGWEKTVHLSKGKTYLDVKPTGISGYCEATQLTPLVILLEKGGKSFRLVSCYTFEKKYSLTEEEEILHYNTQCKNTVERQLMHTLTARKQTAEIEKTIMEIAQMIHIPTFRHAYRINKETPVYRYVHSIYQKMSDRNRIGEDGTTQYPALLIQTSHETQLQPTAVHIPVAIQPS